MNNRYLNLCAGIGIALSPFAAGAADAFLEDGRLAVGVNYWGSKSGVRMWRADEWDEASVEKDIAALAANGVEIMRVFPTWDAFQPLSQEMKFQGIPGMYVREDDDRPVFDPLWLDEGAVSRFETFCDIAARHKVKIAVSLVTGWMSGRVFAPRIVERKNLVADPDAIMWEGRFVRAFVRRMKGHPAIVAWDLGNECNCLGRVESRAQAWNWLNTISSAIRLEDPSRPVVSGMHAQTSNGHGRLRGDMNYWSLQMQGELLDVLTPHPYPAPWRIEANRGPFNSFRNALHPVSQCLFYSAVSGKRSFPQEVGNFGPSMSSDQVAAKGMRQQMFACWQHGLGAYLWWCAFEQMHLGYAPFSLNAMERELGILRADAERTPKRQALAIKEFREFRDSLPFRALPPRRTDAVCLVSEREEFYHQTFGALMLSKAAGFDVEFAAADSRAIPESDFYILPSGKAWETWGQETWEALVERVRRGATLLVSRGGDAGYSRWLEATGLEQSMYRKARTISFEFEGRKMSVKDAFTVLQRPVDCEAVASDGEGSAVVSVKKLGEGRVIAVNFALEKCIIEDEGEVVDDGFSNELWRIYSFAARLAGVDRVAKKDDPRLVLTEHPRPDGSVLVCALNTTPGKASFALSVDGAVENAWNCEWQGGRVVLDGNSGGVFEVRRPGAGEDRREARRAFADLKLGIFLHWGIYAVYGQGEWYQEKSGIRGAEYETAANAFYPHDFDAREWAKSFKAAGAKYVVFTARHHDGFSMFDTKASDYDVVDATPFGRDVVKELADACREEGLKFGLYYSLMDWHHPSYPTGRDRKSRAWLDPAKENYDDYLGFMKAQLTELLTNYGDVLCVWFDGEWDHDPGDPHTKGRACPPLDWRFDEIYSLIHRLQPKCLVLNNHHHAMRDGEDIQGFERDAPGENKTGYSGRQVVERDFPVERCDTMVNGAWGYQAAATSWKSPEEIRALVRDTNEKGANLLLNIGPQPDGRLPRPAVELLRSMQAHD